jgi:transposase
MNISESAMRRWVKQYQQELQGITPSKGRAITAEQREIQELRKRIALLEEEKTILKKATALLMSDSIKPKR